MYHLKLASTQSITFSIHHHLSRSVFSWTKSTFHLCQTYLYWYTCSCILCRTFVNSDGHHLQLSSNTNTIDIIHNKHHICGHVSKWYIHCKTNFQGWWTDCATRKHCAPRLYPGEEGFRTFLMYIVFYAPRLYPGELVSRYIFNLYSYTLDPQNYTGFTLLRNFLCQKNVPKKFLQLKFWVSKNLTHTLYFFNRSSSSCPCPISVSTSAFIRLKSDPIESAAVVTSC